MMSQSNNIKRKTNPELEKKMRLRLDQLLTETKPNDGPITPSIRMKDAASVSKKLTKLYVDGIDHLHIISDFDMTLTRYMDPKTNQRSVSSHGIMERSNLPSAEFKEKSRKSYEKYYPIEISNTIPYEEKVAHMYDWTKYANQLSVHYKFTKKDILKMVDEVRVVFRPGCHEFADLCKVYDIPLLVFSAGLGDLIDFLMKQEGFSIPSMHIVSNMMIFDDDEDGTVIGFKDPLIHVFNKNEANVKDTPYYPTIAEKNNVILMGDSIGDPFMASGLSHEVELKIGYLNHDEEELMEKYLGLYDIVLLNDPPMDFVNTLIKIISHHDVQVEQDV